MNSFWKATIKKAGLSPIIKRLLRKWWGKYSCMCIEAPKSAIGITMNLETGKVTHFWCANCGGYRKSPGKYRVVIENTN